MEVVESFKTCFVVMPITVPAHLHDRYAGRTDHFTKIFEVLIAPAVEKAGLTVLPPARTGTENIQAAIINDLRNADLVLADLSGLNPNVFLELGIRSALDRPVCLVWDGMDKLPFDAGTLNTHPYEPRPIYDLNTQIEKMAAFISATIAKSDGRNELWKFFGSASEDLPVAELDPDDASLHAKLDRLVELVESQRTDRRQHVSTQPVSEPALAELAAAIRAELHAMGDDGLHGTKAGAICRRLLGDGYSAFLHGETLSAALTRIGVPIRTDSSGFFYLAPEVESES